MAGGNKNRELIKEIKSGNQDILLYLFKKYYHDMKHVFQSRNVEEKDILAQAAAVIVQVWMEIQRNDFSENIELESYLLNTSKDNAERLAAEKKANKKNKLTDVAVDERTPREIIAECVNVLDTASRQALQWHYAENQSIEKVAEKLKIDVAAAHDFIGKAFTQLSSIVKIRMAAS